MAAVAYSHVTSSSDLGSWPRVANRPGSPTPTRRRPDLRLSRRRRAVALFALASAVVVLVVALRLALAGPGGGALTTTGSTGAWRTEPIGARMYVVRPGDTLWSIVRASGVRGDPRPAVDRLAATIGGRPLQIGQRLQLP